MLKVTEGKRMYPTGIKRVDDVITIRMITLSMNMPMNLMGAGIKAAPTISPGTGRHFTFKEKIFTSITERPLKKHDQLRDMGFVVHSIWSCDYLRERRMLRDDDVPLPKEKCNPINIRDSYFGGRTMNSSIICN